MKNLIKINFFRAMANLGNVEKILVSLNLKIENVLPICEQRQRPSTASGIVFWLPHSLHPTHRSKLEWS